MPNFFASAREQEVDVFWKAHRMVWDQSLALILYGKGNPVDALDVFGSLVRGVHAKDGFYPTNGHELGEEVKVGTGKVNFPVFLRQLKAVGYDGSLTIEREISGEQQIKDILETKQYLTDLIATL